MLRGFRRGEPIRVSRVQLGGSLAGKLSSKLSSSLSSEVVTAGISGWRLRRVLADPRCAIDRGAILPAALLSAAEPPNCAVRMIHLLPPLPNRHARGSVRRQAPGDSQILRVGRIGWLDFRGNQKGKELGTIDRR